MLGLSLVSPRRLATTVRAARRPTLEIVEGKALFASDGRHIEGPFGLTGETQGVSDETKP
jgi:hypothetical protein